MCNPIESLMDSAIGNIKAMVDVDTVIGEPVTTAEGTVIIPVSTVSFGFGAGGSEFAPKAATKFSEKTFGGGCGGGGNVKPCGFLIVAGQNVRYLPMSSSSSPVDKIVDLVPEMIDKVNKVITNHKKKKEEKQGEE